MNLPLLLMQKRLLILLASLFTWSISSGQCLPEVYTGEGTYYPYAGGGNCSYPNPYTPLYSAALNGTQYGTSELCGACAEVTGPSGSLLVSIEDQCPECAHGDLDFEQEAFPFIADPVLGRVDISWKIVACPVSGPVSFEFKEGSSQWWTAVQVRNHRYPVSKFEYKNSSGNYIVAQRVSYNYFLENNGMGPGPYAFRITDILGQVLEFKIIPLTPNGTVQGDKQFPDCGVLSTNTKADAYKIKVYPNPSADKTRFIVNHETFDLDLQLYDLTGRCIKSCRATAKEETKIELPEKGTYILRINGPDEKSSYEKLVEY